MNVFIGNLPDAAKLVELHDLVGDFELRADYQCHRGRDSNGVFYHYFIARTENQQQGAQLIKRLDGMIFKGKVLSVRECITRNPQGNDWQGEDRRINP